MRKSVLPLILAAAVVLAVGVYLAVVVMRSDDERAPSSEPAASGPARATPQSTPSTPPAEFPADGKVFLGLQTATGPHDFAPAEEFAAATGYAPSVLQFTQGWADDRFDPALFDRVADRGMLPIVAWEPWDHSATGVARSRGAQPEYRLSRIIDGAFDDYIRSWAEGIRDLGYPVGVRFAHEMNGFWYPWCEQSNGNRPGEYVKAYRHIYQLFADAGATNAIWLWSPNVTYPGAEPLADLYPGDEYVDWVGLSGYYGTEGMKSYKSFDQIFAATFKELRGFTSRPIVITETGATDSNGHKARWIRQAFQQLPKHRDVIGVVWFELRNDVEWRVVASRDATKAFADGSADDRYTAPWSTNTVARTSVS